MGASPEMDGSSADGEMKWCLRALVRHLADGSPDADVEDRFKRSVVHKRTVDTDSEEFIGGAVCTVAGGCVVSFGFEGEPVPDTGVSKVGLSSERFGHTAVCNEPPAEQGVIVLRN